MPLAVRMFFLSVGWELKPSPDSNYIFTNTIWKFITFKPWFGCLPAKLAFGNTFCSYSLNLSFTPWIFFLHSKWHTLIRLLATQKRNIFQLNKVCSAQKYNIVGNVEVSTGGFPRPPQSQVYMAGFKKEKWLPVTFHIWYYVSLRVGLCLILRSVYW